jgi:predicted nucleic acid-binding protein
LKIYVDTSFLISLYSPDANSRAAAAGMHKHRGERLISVLGELEVMNALGLRVFRKEISPTQSQASWDSFQMDTRDGVFLLRVLPDQVFERARTLSRQNTPRMGIRTADLLHIAAALEFGANYLFSFDQQQRRLARALRLKLN